MKDFDQIDHLFDEALSRADAGKLTKDLSGLGPLASDHFLLKKSWDFFKGKMKQMEENFKEILQKKDKDLSQLRDALDSLQSRHATCEAQQNDEETLEEAFVREKLGEFERFKREQEKIRQATAEERVRLEDGFRSLEATLGREREKNQSLQEALAQKKDAYQKIVDRLELDKETLLRNRIENEKKLREEIALLGDELASRQAQIDLLKKEVSVRNDEIKKLDWENREFKINQEKSHLLRKELQGQIHNLGETIQTHQKENEELKARVTHLKEGWERERSQWRELWDQARELWDAKRRSNKPENTSQNP